MREDIDIIRIAGTDDILGVVPAVLGFHPTDSVVIVCLAGKHGRVGPVIRCDISADGRLAKEAIGALVGPASRYADAVIVITYGLPHIENIDALTTAIEECCPVAHYIATDNAPHRVHPRMAAEAAGSGRAILPTRSAIVDQITYRDDATLPEAYRPYLAAMNTIAGRDRFMAEHINDVDVIAGLITVARATAATHPHAADLLAVTAAIAYRTGDPALADAALIRARQADPDHQLTWLMSKAINVGLLPGALDSMATI